MSICKTKDNTSLSLSVLRDGCMPPDHHVQLISCPYCSRSGLKGGKGLNLHLANSPTCQECAQQSKKKLVAPPQIQRDLGESTPITPRSSPTQQCPHANLSHALEQLAPGVDGHDQGSNERQNNFPQPVGDSDDNGPSEDQHHNRPGYRMNPGGEDTRFEVHSSPEHGCTYGQRETRWEHLDKLNDPTRPYHPWRSREEFELVNWLSSASLSQAHINCFLKLSFVSQNASNNAIVNLL